MLHIRRLFQHPSLRIGMAEPFDRSVKYLIAVKLSIGMNWGSRKRVRIIVGSLAILAAVIILIVWLGRISKDEPRALLTISRSSPTQNNSPAIPAGSSPTPSANPASPIPSASTSPSPTVPVLPGATTPSNLIIPVAGVRREQLHDTFSESRSEGRVHDAIDIAAPLGTPVLATADGPIVKLFHSERGGITIYQLSTDNKLVYYYAHLDRYAEGLTEGHFAKQGETIAYVGDSGNAGAGNYHLHFSIASIPDSKHYWQGTNLNPYPLLVR